MNIYITYLSSLPIALFFLCSILLVCGILGEIWTHAISLSWLNSESLAKIEKQHPYLPSLKIVAGIVLCSIALLLVSLHTLQGFYPLAQLGPIHWLVSASFFILMCTAGIMFEIKWKGAADYAFAFTVSTALAFIFLVVRNAVTLQSMTVGTFALLVLLLVSLAVAWTLFYRVWNTRVQAVAIGTFLFWVFLFIVG